MASFANGNCCCLFGMFHVYMFPSSTELRVVRSCLSVCLLLLCQTGVELGEACNMIHAKRCKKMQKEVGTSFSNNHVAHLFFFHTSPRHLKAGGPPKALWSPALRPGAPRPRFMDCDNGIPWRLGNLFPAVWSHQHFCGKKCLPKSCLIKNP